MFLRQLATNCYCNDNKISNQFNSIQQELIDKGNKLYLYQSYESGKGLSNEDILFTLFKKDSIDITMNRLCKLSNDMLHTEESYLEKYCHENEPS